MAIMATSLLCPDMNESGVCSGRARQAPAHVPTVVLLIGMAGSGKTTVMQRLHAHLHPQSKRPYIVNLDPAVTHLPYTPNIDIRDTVQYPEVMKQYQLGPNGAILTSLNLFTTKFDQVLGLLDKRKDSVDYILIDTPGQIEAFTWSASGSIITEALAASYPTVVLFVVDTPRTGNPATFMSNMLYACSILYRTRLPFIVLFNKADVLDCDFAIDWMKDYDAFQTALHAMTPDGHDPPYMHSFVQSMSLVLDEFYSILSPVKFSAVTGLGSQELLVALEKAKVEYEQEYKPELERMIAERNQRVAGEKQQQLSKLMRDIKLEEEKEGKQDKGKGKQK
ncbi:hypothetical protein BCR44DRAFT_1493496 [Catenaria anguillulae PL171]|uniref:GPN-loop GTPase n=1 Tax=Catenaria anguillulae PL171 TaxID=765915 RepID=A0A1Y2HI91_9FUNG|nr:hypothetical protein BCR44DRAFT_1493496 [Catenaria anguillulae PL171]